METATDANASDTNVVFGKATIGLSAIDVEWTKELSNSVYSFLDTSICVDEFNEFYLTATCQQKADDTTQDSLWVCKLSNSGSIIWNKRYVMPDTGITAVNKGVIDIFGDLNVGYSQTNSTNGYAKVGTIKIGYDGIMKKHTTNELNKNNIEGLRIHSLSVDNSGDVYSYGQTVWNRNEFIFKFDSGETTDTTGHYTPTFIGEGDALALDSSNGLVKFLGRDTVNPSTWENAAIQFTAASLGTRLAEDWTMEFMLYKDGSVTNTHGQNSETLIGIGDATDTTGGLWLYYDKTTPSNGSLTLVVTNSTTALNAAGSALTSTVTTMYADNTWQFIGIKKAGDLFTVYVNGISVVSGTLAATSLGNKDLWIGNQPGWSGTTGQFQSGQQGQWWLDNLRLRNRAVTPTVPADIVVLPLVGAFAPTYDWQDDAWFTLNLNQYDYIDYVGWG